MSELCIYLGYMICVREVASDFGMWSISGENELLSILILSNEW